MSALAAHGALERALHRVAFVTRIAQRGVADLETRLFGKELTAIEAGPPVLVAALPRAGTTMLLRLFAQCPEFATQTYRDMPFVLCPMLWRAFTRRHRRPAAPQERAHGDGIEVSHDSPEAFEEVLWRTFWPEHYRERAIAPWTTCDRPAFVRFYAEHRRKVVALRRRDEPRARRYLAKNNADVARVPAIWTALPDATLVVPFRDPVQQAASLLRQHERFLLLHRRDAFLRRYMAAIGHFEFGANLRPIDFDGRFGASGVDPREQALQLAFWLESWSATYRHLLAHAGDSRLVFVDFAHLAATRDTTRLAARLDIEDAAALQRGAAVLRPLPVHDVELGAVPRATQDAARDTFALLRRNAR